MSQHDFTIANQGMPAARADINAALQALASTNKGPSAPSTPYTGELWIDDAASPWTLKLYDGTDWIAVGTINPTTNLFQATNHARTDQTVNMTAAINEAGWVDLASAATCNIGAAASNSVRITGATTITSFGTAASGIRRILRFAGALTLTHNATSLILPGNASLTTAANDTATFVSLGSGNWICADYKRASGQAVVSGTNYFALVRDEKSDGTNGGSSVTGSWQTRNLNSEVFDPNNIVSVSGNRFSLIAGNYLIKVRSPFQATGGTRVRIQNVTDSSTISISESNNIGLATGFNTAFNIEVTGYISIGSSKEFEIQYQCTSVRSTDGLGVDDDLALGPEIYTTVLIEGLV